MSSGFSAVTLPSLRFQVILLGALDVFDTDLNNDQNLFGLALGKFWKNSLRFCDRRDLQARRRSRNVSHVFVLGFLFALRLAVSFLFNRCLTSLSNQGRDLHFLMTFVGIWRYTASIKQSHQRCQSLSISPELVFGLLELWVGLLGLLSGSSEDINEEKLIDVRILSKPSQSAER